MNSVSDRVLLWFNKWSNNYGKSYIRSILFTLIVPFPFFYLSILGTNHFEFNYNITGSSILEGLKYFIQFLVPTHKFNYIEENPNFMFYLFDFLGRIFVGYGIYQTIQAFRKFK